MRCHCPKEWYWRLSKVTQNNYTSYGARPWGRCDMRSSRIIADYRLSQKLSISAREMYLAMQLCRMGRWSFWSCFGVNRLLTKICAKNDFYMFVPSDLDLALSVRSVSWSVGEIILSTCNLWNNFKSKGSKVKCQDHCGRKCVNQVAICQCPGSHLLLCGPHP